MPVEGVGLVLGENGNLPVARIDQIGQNKVDEAVVSTEWDGRLCTVFSKREKPLTFTAGEDNS